MVTQILEAVWQYDFGGDSVVVERFVSNLRRKVDDGHEALIQTVRGVGIPRGPIGRGVERLGGAGGAGPCPRTLVDQRSGHRDDGRRRAAAAHPPRGPDAQ
ncbi:winged helix-turn-helix domain-containing protein [Cellulomonas chengniuliangii]|uniref:winged helix-turn-helix domain-containing protein n=1 Tax=Cellulomonas chengniuliangii TaxID=2968084 RepID=UPI0027E182A4|nr:winged helix-turn-helix domain-containing protein [Cellulomonas chengniuliangii]